MDWTIRQLKAGDENVFVPFLGQWINNRCVRAHFDWLYRANPHGHAITWIAALSANDQIVGCTSVFPRWMRLWGKPIRGGFGGDAFVDPNFRRRGIAQALHEHSVADMKELDIQCNFGFPVPANFRAFLRAGALAPCDFHTYTLPLNASVLIPSASFWGAGKLLNTVLNPAVHLYRSRRALRWPVNSRKVAVVDAFGAGVNDLFESVAGEFGVCCARDKDYLNWRFSKNPFDSYTQVEFWNNSSLDGYAVLRLDTEHCKIIDFVSRDADFASKCLSALVRFAIDRGKSCVSLQLNPDGPCTPMFKHSGFVQHGNGRRLMALTVHDAEKDAQFNDPRNWFLMPGDDDVA